MAALPNGLLEGYGSKSEESMRLATDAVMSRLQNLRERLDSVHALLIARSRVTETEIAETTQLCLNANILMDCAEDTLNELEERFNLKAPKVVNPKPSKQVDLQSLENAIANGNGTLTPNSG